MLHLCHFSFDLLETEPQHGYFTCIVEAGNPDESLDKCRNLLQDLRMKGEIFEAPATVYLDQIISLKKIPTDGLLAHMLIRKGELPSATSISLPGTGSEYGEAFGVGPDRADDRAVEIEPFMTFE